MVESKWFPASTLEDGTAVNYGRTCTKCGTWKTAAEHKAQRIPAKGRVYIGTVCKACTAWPKPEPRPCANPACGRVYTPQVASGMYCSRACGSEAWRMRNVADGLKLCSRCDEWLPAGAYFRRDGELVHTCKGCRARYGLQEAQCQNPECDQTFLPDRTTDRYCSERCNWTASRRRNGYRRRAVAVVDGQRVCTMCGETKAVEEFSQNAGRSTSRCKSCASDVANRRNKAKVRQRLGLPEGAHVRSGPKPIGATYVTQHGYVMEKRPGHHRATSHGYVLQHVLVAEEKYGFAVTTDFTVDHLNDQRHDNRPENLELRVGNHGRHGKLVPTLLARDEERGIAVAELLNHPGYRAELFAEMTRRGYVVLQPYPGLQPAA